MALVQLTRCGWGIRQAKLAELLLDFGELLTLLECQVLEDLL